MQTHRGFTLIELMIVIAILGILFSIALPAYLEYSTRARVAEGVSLAKSAKLAVTETYNDRGTLLAGSNLAYGLAESTQIIGSWVESVEVQPDTGEIRVTFRGDPRIAGQYLSLLPTTSPNLGIVAWDCTGGTLAQKYRPSACRL